MVLVRQLDDEDDDGPLHLPRLVRLELVRGGDDEGEGGEDDHREGEECQQLRQAAGPRVLQRVPQPAPHLATHHHSDHPSPCLLQPDGTVPEVLLLRGLHRLDLGTQVHVLLILAEVHLRKVLKSTASLFSKRSINLQI